MNKAKKIGATIFVLMATIITYLIVVHSSILDFNNGDNAQVLLIVKSLFGISCIGFILAILLHSSDKMQA